MSQGKRILVTGGAGFIGSHVVDGFVRAGHTVAVLDDLSTGSRGQVNPEATLYRASVSDAQAVEAAFQEFRPRVVDHHAAQASVVRSMREPAADALTNVLGSLNVLEAARSHGVERFLFASTGGALYGEPDYLPCDEEHPVRPLSVYGAAKHAFEVYLRIYHQSYGLPATVLRYANVYGPRQDPYGEAGVIAIFARRMMEGQTPTIFGTGEQERDFVYVADVVQANLLGLSAPAWGVYNIGTGVGVSVNRIAQLLRDITRYAGPLRQEPPRPGEVQRISLSSSRAQRELGWTPHTPLEEGLALTVHCLRQARTR